MLPPLLTADEVASVFRVTESTVRRWARTNVIAPVRVPGVRKTLFRREDIEALVQREAS